MTASNRASSGDGMTGAAKVKFGGRANGSAQFSPFVVDDCAQFSLDPEDDAQRPSGSTEAGQREQLLGVSRIRPAPPAQNGNAQRSHSENNRAPTTWRDKAPESQKQREVSPLTDEIELDGDSASDDLDLLPPMTSSTTRTGRRKLQKFIRCCAPHGVPSRCAIM